jgi:hypothetical protein
VTQPIVTLMLAAHFRVGSAVSETAPCLLRRCGEIA